MKRPKFIRTFFDDKHFKRKSQQAFSFPTTALHSVRYLFRLFTSEAFGQVSIVRCQRRSQPLDALEFSTISD